MTLSPIVAPMLAMMVLTFVVWAYMYAKRIPFLQSLDLPANEITPQKLVELSPPEVANPSDNLKNLFELPVLFYALCLYLHISGEVDSIYLTAAWLFVAFRILHSIMHCSKNIVLVRFGLYLAASVALWVMLFRVLWVTLNS